jgi:FixJ family two-component response regulator
VELHRARIMEKMGAHSIAQLVRMMMDTQPWARILLRARDDR